jgi:hypothetical protein
LVAQQTKWERIKKNIDQGLQRVDEADRQRIKATDESRKPNLWLGRTSWARHLAGLDHVKLRDLVRPVDEQDDAELSVIHVAFDGMIRAAQQIAVTEVVGQAALFEAHRKEVDKKPDKPFHSGLSKGAFKAYTGVWKQLLIYIWRAGVAKEASQESGDRTSTRAQYSVVWRYWV